MAHQEDEQSESLKDPQVVEHLHYSLSQERDVGGGQDTLDHIHLGVALIPRMDCLFKLIELDDLVGWPRDPKPEVEDAIGGDMPHIVLVPEVFDVVTPRVGLEVLQVLVDSQPCDRDHARHIACNDDAHVLLENLEHKGYEVEDQVDEEEALLPPLGVLPLVVYQVLEQKLVIEIHGRIPLNIIDDISQVKLGKAHLRLFLKLWIHSLLLDPFNLVFQVHLPEVDDVRLDLKVDSVLEVLYFQLFLDVFFDSTLLELLGYFTGKDL